MIHYYWENEKSVEMYRRKRERKRRTSWTLCNWIKLFLAHEERCDVDLCALRCFAWILTHSLSLLLSCNAKRRVDALANFQLGKIAPRLAITVCLLMGHWGHEWNAELGVWDFLDCQFSFLFFVASADCLKKFKFKIEIFLFLLNVLSRKKMCRRRKLIFKWDYVCVFWRSWCFDRLDFYFGV